MLARSVFRPGTLVPLLLFGLIDAGELFTDLRWVGSLRWALDWANAGLFLGCALLAPITVLMSRSLFRTYLDLVRPRGLAPGYRLVASVFARNVVSAYVVHLIVMVGAAIASIVKGASDGFELTPFLYALLPIATFSALGTLIALYTPSIVAVLPALAIAYAVSFAAATGQIIAPTPIGGWNVSLVGLHYDRAALLTYLGATTFTCAVVLVAMGLLLRARSGGLATVVLVGGLIAAFVGPAIVVHPTTQRVAIDANTRAVKFECAGTAPRVCLAQGNTARLTRTAAEVRTTSRPLVDAGISLSGVTLYEQLPSDRPSYRAILMLTPSDLNLGDFSALEYAGALTRPVDCQAYYGGGAETLFSAADRLARDISAANNGKTSVARSHRIEQNYQLLRQCKS